jgi:ubiquinone/menaquinone biosynthesis C-methylase UbiE
MRLGMRVVPLSPIALMLASLVLAPAPRADHDAHPSPAPQAQRGHTHGGPRADHHEHRFDDATQWAKRFDDPARDAWQQPERVIEALALKPGQKVADLGAGTGYFTVRLARAAAAPKVYAIDIESSMVDYLRARAQAAGLANVVAVKADAERTNLPEPVDLVLIVDTYHHLPHRVAYFKALRALLNPAAQVAIIDFKKGAPTGPPEEFRLTPEEIGTELRQAGYALRAQHDFLPYQHFLVYGLQ